MDWPRIERIGVFKLRNIGDVLIITPALRALRQFFPHAQITAVVNSVTDAILRGNPDVDRLIVYNRSDNPVAKVFKDFRFFSQIARGKFDLVFDFTKGDRPAFCSWISGAKIRVASYGGWSKSNWRNWAYTHIVPASPPGHEVEQHLFVLEQLGIPAQNKKLRLEISETDRNWAREITANLKGKRLVHIHPVARWLFKCWDNAKMASIIDWMQTKKNTAVVVTSSDDTRELDRTDSILKLCRTKPLYLGGKTTLPQLGALSAQSACFFGVDTAPMHIAAAVGAPVVALFGPTYPASWHPWCDKQITLRKPCICEQKGGEQCDWSKVRACLQDIQIEEVQAALETFLK